MLVFFSFAFEKQTSIFNGNGSKTSSLAVHSFACWSLSVLGTLSEQSMWRKLWLSLAERKMDTTLYGFISPLRYMRLASVGVMDAAI